MLRLPAGGATYLPDIFMTRFLSLALLFCAACAPSHAGTTSPPSRGALAQPQSSGGARAELVGRLDSLARAEEPLAGLSVAVLRGSALCYH